MTQDEILELARQAAAQITIQANGDVFYSFYGIELEAFAKLVAEKAIAEAEKQEPVARVTGVYGGRFVVEPLNPAMVLPVNMALYTRPQPRKE